MPFKKSIYFLTQGDQKQKQKQQTKTKTKQKNQKTVQFPYERNEFMI